MASAVISNTLYYGDNLDVLQKHFPLRDYFDLIYLDPPFNSKADYNILFKERSGKESIAQAQAFSDFWHWDMPTAETYSAIQKDPNIGTVITFLHEHLGQNDMMAYLVMMTVRLKKLHGILKPTGSLYLHCDPTASHYLKIILDTVFGVENFRNEIIWKRTHAHSGAKRLGPVHDVILFYTKTDNYVWNPQHLTYSEEYLHNFFRFNDPDGKIYRLTILTGSGVRYGSSGKPWRGINPTKIGRHWAIPSYVRPLLGELSSTDVQAALDKLDNIGRIVWTKKKGGTPSFKQYKDDMLGVNLQDIWVDLPPIASQANERLGYPTQKPQALLERIIQSSSNEGDLVLDPFCGCGTTIMAAQQLEHKRRWVGIDITHLAISLIRSRLRQIHVYPNKDYQIIGEPADFESAATLMKIDKSGYQFQLWALSLIEDAFPAKLKDGKVVKGSDKGVDGWSSFKEGDNPNRKRIVISVKGGDNIGVQMVRDLIGTVEATHSAMGILITLLEPTEPMKNTALECGFYESPVWRHHYPKIQLITIPELLAKKKPNIPPTQ